MRFKTEDDLTGMAVKRSIPLRAYFDLTYKCDLKCIHCYEDFPHPGKELSFKEVISVLEQLVDAGTLYIVFCGGEPLIRKDFIDILSYARKLGFAVTILTNATLIIEEIADKISNLYPSLVQISLYGASEEAYERVTGKPHLFHSAVKGIRLLSERDVWMKVVSQIFNFNTVEDILAMKRICQKLGVGWEASSNFVMRMNGNPYPFNYRLSESQLEEFSSIIPKLHDDDYSKKKTRKNALVCEKGCNIHIAANGQIGICWTLLSKSSVKEKPLLDIWKNDPFLQMSRRIKWKDLPDCLKCSSFTYCRPCPGFNFLATGSFSKIPPGFCQEAHIFKKVRERLYANKCEKSFCNQ